ncbi:MAG: hypothetical protein HY593_02305 [Candidatus Omnitrophica bacterium]|nr:hypothetical protein [Candidatus Omnitrophota bacterium]
MSKSLSLLQTPSGSPLSGGGEAWTFLLLFCLAFSFFLGGCGYTTRSLLPAEIRTVHVAPVKNVIDLSAEVSHEDAFRLYRPGLEVDITNAVINRFIFDGHLKPASPERADAVLEAKLVDFRREPLRYSDADDVQEYRLSVVIDAALYAGKDRKVLWREEHLTGDVTFFLSGPRSVSEEAALARVVEDTARRVVEKTVEVW